MRKERHHLALGLACLILLQAAAVVRGDEAALQREALTLNGVLGEQAIDAKVLELIKNPERSKKLLATAATMHGRNGEAFNYSGSIILAMTAKELKQSDQASIFFARALDKAKQMKSDRRISQIYYHWVVMHIEQQKYADAEVLCKQVLELQADPNEIGGDQEALASAKLFALRRMVQVSALQGKLSQAEQTLKPFLEKDSENLDVMDVHAWLLRYQEKHDEALRVYEKLVAALPSEDRFDVYRDGYKEIMGSIHGDLGNLDKAMEYLLPLLKKNPDDPGLNNDIGYMWAENDRNLDDAEKMIRKALAKEPENPSFLDSMGWVLFKQKNYDEAKKFLLKATAIPRGNNTEILDHLGDVHAALGNTKEALAAWQKAVQIATTRQRDLKRKEKIEEKIKNMQN